MLRWRGQFYLVDCELTPGQETVTIAPANAELRAAVLSSLKANPGKPLGVYWGFRGDYLLDDPRQGEA